MARCTSTAPTAMIDGQFAGCPTGEIVPGRLLSLPAAAMIVTAESLSGTVGGGALEMVGIERARAMLRDGAAEDRLAIPLGPAIGQCCGGHVTLTLTRLDAGVLAAEVAADAARDRRGGVGGAGEGAEALDAPLALDDDGRHGAGGHEGDEGLEERLALVLGVVAVEAIGVGREHLEGDEPVALGLDPAQHLPGESAGEGVGLDEDE